MSFVLPQALLSLIEDNYRRIMIDPQTDVLPELREKRGKMYKRAFKEKRKALDAMSGTEEVDELQLIMLQALNLKGDSKADNEAASNGPLGTEAGIYFSLPLPSPLKVDPALRRYSDPAAVSA